MGRPQTGASTLRQRLKLEKTSKLQIRTVAELPHRASSSNLSLSGKTLGENYSLL